MSPEFPADLPDGQPIVIAGAGAAGMAAAIAAARQGADVILAESSARLGGTVTHSLIHTIGGLYDSEGKLLNEGLSIELVERLSGTDPHTRKRKIGRTWVLNVSPEEYERAVEVWLSENPRLHVLRNTTVTGAADDASVLHTIELTAHGETTRIHPAAVIDATGTAEVVRMLDAALVDDDQHAAAGLVFTMRGVDTEILSFPKGVGLLRKIRAAADAGELPKQCGMTWLDYGVYKDEVYIKLFLPLGENWRTSDAIRNAEKHAHLMRDALVAFLADEAAFAAARTTRTGRLGIREGGRAKGKYRLSDADVRNRQRFSDAIGRCSWPIEYWDPEKGVTLEYLSGGDYFEIPMRALQVRDRSNVWVAGKCLSAEPLAQASVRVAGACWAMGEAVGRMAAQLK